MMRGADLWAVAVREPAGDVHVESHDIDSVANRHPILARSRSCAAIIVLGQSLAIGVRALSISANQSLEEDEQLSRRQVGVALAVAMIVFIGDLRPGADHAVRLGRRTRRLDGVLVNVARGRVPRGAVPRLPRG